MEDTKALIVLDTEIVATTKRDQAVWLLQQGVKEREAIVDDLVLLEVVDDETKVLAERGIMRIRSTRKAQDEGRKDWGRVFDLAKKAMDAAMRQHVDGPEEQIQKSLNDRKNRYVEQVREAEAARAAEAQRAAAEAQAKLDEERRIAEEAARIEAEAKGTEFVPPPAQGIPEVVAKAEPPRVIPTAEGMKTRRHWRHRVVDLSQVPDAYTKRVIDDDAVEAAIGAATTKKPNQPSQCSAQIPGIEIYPDDRPA